MADVPEDLSAFADELADAAGAVITYWRTSVEVISKDARLDVFADEPVTIADRESERVMRDMIEQRYPAHAILGEEHGEKGDGKTSEWAWVLDPVDGTKSFITASRSSGTLIALLNYGKPVLGVIGPVRPKRALEGHSAKNDLQRAALSHGDDCTSLNEAMVYATTPEMFAPGFEDESMELLELAVQARCIWVLLLRVWAVCVRECAASVRGGPDALRLPGRQARRVLPRPHDGLGGPALDAAEPPIEGAGPVCRQCAGHSEALAALRKAPFSLRRRRFFLAWLRRRGDGVLAEERESDQSVVCSPSLRNPFCMPQKQVLVTSFASITSALRPHNVGRRRRSSTQPVTPSTA